MELIRWTICRLFYLSSFLRPGAYVGPGIYYSPWVILYPNHETMTWWLLARGSLGCCERGEGRAEDLEWRFIFAHFYTRRSTNNNRQTKAQNIRAIKSIQETRRGYWRLDQDFRSTFQMLLKVYYTLRKTTTWRRTEGRVTLERNLFNGEKVQRYENKNERPRMEWNGWQTKSYQIWYCEAS